MTRWLAGADVGGTFTDLVLYDAETRRLVLHKLLTTPDDPRRAIIDGLAALATRADIVVHGTTLVTNALIERRGAPVGLITTEGYRDVLEIGNELRYDTFDLQLERPAPLVERRLRKAVPERIGADGRVVLPLDEERERRRLRTGQLDLDVLTKAAAMAPGATAVAGELLAPDAQRRQRLDDLHRAADDVGGEAGR